MLFGLLKLQVIIFKGAESALKCKVSENNHCIVRGGVVKMNFEWYKSGWICRQITGICVSITSYLSLITRQYHQLSLPDNQHHLSSRTYQLQCSSQLTPHQFQCCFTSADTTSVPVLFPLSWHHISSSVVSPGLDPPRWSCPSFLHSVVCSASSLLTLEVGRCYL